MQFKNRQDAGQLLAEKLMDMRGKNAAVLALPRWGVLVGYEVAKILDLPLDTLVVRKLWVMDNPEFAFGAIAEGSITVMDKGIIGATAMSPVQVESVVRMERGELERRKKEYNSGEYIKERMFDQIIIVDDGLATGATMEAAIQATKTLYNPPGIIVAVPVAASDSVRKIERKVDRFVVLYQSYIFWAVGQYYESFLEVSDEEVRTLLCYQKNAIEAPV